MGEGMQELLRQMASKIFGEAASSLFASTWWCPAVPSTLPHKGRGAARSENVKKKIRLQTVWHEYMAPKNLKSFITP